MERSYPTQAGETRVVGSNLGLPGNYALYLVASGLLGMLFWAIGSVVSGGGLGARMVVLSLALLPPLLTATVIFGFLLGKPPHYATDYGCSLGMRAFGLSRGEHHPVRSRNPWPNLTQNGGPAT